MSSSCGLKGNPSSYAVILIRIFFKARIFTNISCQMHNVGVLTVEEAAYVPS